ncbi:MAG: hypothetical protein ACK40J_05680 [Rhodococcus sp. (in: high G+C Gram-positive bacteria)]
MALTIYRNPHGQRGPSCIRGQRNRGKRARIRQTRASSTTILRAFDERARIRGEFRENFGYLNSRVAA